MSLEYYKLDPAHFFTTPGLTFQAALRYSKVNLELFTDLNMLLTIERGIRGGLSFVGCRESVANNRHLPDTYDDGQESKYIAYLDANNLYAWSLRQFLAIGEYKWLSRAEISMLDIARLPDDGEYGYVFVVDLRYPPELHSKHSDYPLAVEHLLLGQEHLSETVKPLLGGKRYSGVKKLVSCLSDKVEYVTHYRNLKFYLRHGLVLTRIHSVIRFRQSPWLAGYIEKNTDYRKAARSAFEKDFFKLLNNRFNYKHIS